ncbi:potassium channel family protein [Candidatus Omnitrophota bacterium]
MNIIIIGCGRVGSELAQLLSQQGHNVIIVDKDQGAFTRLGSSFNGVAAMGSGIDEDFLKELGIGKQDAFVAVTSNDSTNLMVSQIAKKIFNIPRVMARVYDPRKADIYKRLGLDIISGTRLLAAMIRDKIIENKFSTYILESGELGVVEVMADKELEGKRVEDISMPGEFMVVALERDGKVMIPRPDMILKERDKLMGILKTESLRKIKEKFKL